MTAPDIRSIIDELIARSGYAAADYVLTGGDLLDLLCLGDLRPALEALPDSPITITARDGDPSEARLRISYEPPDVP